MTCRVCVFEFGCSLARICSSPGSSHHAFVLVRGLAWGSNTDGMFPAEPEDGDSAFSFLLRLETRVLFLVYVLL